MFIDAIGIFQELVAPKLCTAPREKPARGCQGRSPLVVCQLFLQQKHLGLELVPLMQHVPQLLQREPGAVGVLGVHGRLVRLRDTLLSARLRLEEAEMLLMNSRPPPPTRLLRILPRPELPTLPGP